MAEFEEVFEVFEEAESGIAEEGEAMEGLDAEEMEELQEEANVARQNVSTLRSVVDYIKDLNIPGALKAFTKFVVKNAAVGAIFYGVTVLLSKLAKQSKGSKAAQAKYEKTYALSTLIDDMTKTSQKAVDWMKAHENDTIDLEGISIPLIDIFTKYTGPMGDTMEKAYEVAKDLTTKDSKGKVTFNVPTTGQVNTIVDSAKGFVDALDGFVKFAEEKQSSYPQLATLTVTHSDVVQLNTDLQKVTSMPYC
ncbi:uncharacterized protein LOC135502923 isoform X2 [Lineus longissimus]|uniref:uncharacterized protein LOC135502923 isoform X2 n=1 Tax=Lineus longissimus TaxID=88925 RepID=UPI00315DA9A3